MHPRAHLTAPEFLMNFVPYFVIALPTAALAGAGSYTFTALALAAASFWVFIDASLLRLARGPKPTPDAVASEAAPVSVHAS